jgi:hypothetical protein
MVGGLDGGTAGMTEAAAVALVSSVLRFEEGASIRRPVGGPPEWLSELRVDVYWDRSSGERLRALLSRHSSVFVGRVTHSIDDSSPGLVTLHTFDVTRWLSDSRAPKVMHYAQWGGFRGRWLVEDTRDPLIRVGEEYLVIGGSKLTRSPGRDVPFARFRKRRWAASPGIGGVVRPTSGACARRAHRRRGGGDDLRGASW